VTVLYKVTNSDTDKVDDLYNAFQMSQAGGLTLASVKQNCRALRSLSHAGADGFHWRVCVEDKPIPGGLDSMFSWWDIQDENARLPVKEATLAHLEKMFMPEMFSGTTSTLESSNKGAKGALKHFGKALQSAVEGGAHSDNGPRVPIIAFKLLDLGKMHHDFSVKHGGSSSGGIERTPRAPKPRPTNSTPVPRTTPQSAPPQRPPPASVPGSQSAQVASRAPAARPAAPQPRADASLMDFGETPSNHVHGMLHRATTSPPSFDSNETRAEKLKREYAKKGAQSNRVWDDIDQRWVEVDRKAGLKAGTTSAPPQAAVASSGSKTIGISLDPSNAVGKSADVQAAVHKRVNDMKESQAKAINELKEREAKKKGDDEAEDEVRKRLEPKIKAWSEEHGQKKQLRALLGTLHIILWPGANWKPVGLGDLLDDGKCKKIYHKATRVVHPDKTIDLDPEKRFLSKRVFDALSQAKTKFDEGSS